MYQKDTGTLQGKESTGWHSSDPEEHLWLRLRLGWEGQFPVLHWVTRSRLGLVGGEAQERPDQWGRPDGVLWSAQKEEDLKTLVLLGSVCPQAEALLRTESPGMCIPRLVPSQDETCRSACCRRGQSESTRCPVFWL